MTRLLAVALTLVCATPALARHHYRHHEIASQNIITCDRFGCRGTIKATMHVERRHHAIRSGETIIGSRPAGCPHAYCGCGLARYLGLRDVRLNLAWNWARMFPHEVLPRPGLAAVRHHHVMYIEAAADNGEWLIRDYNSGGGLSRLHVRDVHGYVFVNPHSSRVAGL